MRTNAPRRLLSVALPLLCSSRNSAAAFVQRGGIRPMVRSPCQQLAMPELRARGGALSAAPDNTSDDENEKAHKVAREAIQSIRTCCKMCFFSVFGDLLTTFIDRDIWSKFFGTDTMLSWMDYFALFDSLALLVFGGGLWRISQLYWGALAYTEERMTQDSLLDLFGTMRWIWGIVTVNLGVASVTLAATLPTRGSDGVFSFVWDTLSSKQLALATVGILAIGGLFVQRSCENTASNEVQAYKERIQEQKRTDRRPTMAKIDLVRATGFRAYRNQALCAGAFAVMAILHLATWIVSFDGGIVGHIFTVSEFLTPFAISGLLFTLNKALLRAAIAEVFGDPARIDIDQDIYSDLFVAQRGFYGKVAETLKGATIFLLLPYIAAPLAPLALPILKSLKGISFFAKAFEAIGIQV